jgi:hypothetical protein
LNREEQPLQVDINQFIEEGLGGVDGERSLIDTSICKQHVNLASVLESHAKHVIDLGDVRHIGANRDKPKL